MNIYILRTKKLYSDPDFHIFNFIIEKRGGIRKFLVNIYVPCTTKLYPDPDFRKFYYTSENGVGFTSFLLISFFFFIIEKRGGILEFLGNDCIPRTKKLNRDPDFHLFLLSRNGVELTGFSWKSIYSALRNCILTLIFILIIECIIVPCITKWCPDPDFRKFYYRRENGVKFVSFL